MQVLASEQMLAEFFQIFGEALLLLLGEEKGDDLIAAFADLAAYLVVGEVFAEVLKGFVPRGGVLVDGIDQSAVHIENHGLVSHVS